MFIEGRLQLESWEDKQSGQKRSRLRVVAENLQLLGNKERAASPSREAPAAAQNPEFHRHRGSQERRSLVAVRLRSFGVRNNTNQPTPCRALARLCAKPTSEKPAKS